MFVTPDPKKCVGHVEHTIEMILKMNGDSLTTTTSPSAEAYISAVASTSNHADRTRAQVKHPHPIDATCKS